MQQNQHQQLSEVSTVSAVQFARKIDQAYCGFKEDIGVLFKKDKNPFFNSKYNKLETIQQAIDNPLKKNNLFILQRVDIVDDLPILVTELRHASGEMFEPARYPLLCVNSNDPQKLAASVTYARRVSIAIVLGLTEDDDDGNTAAGHESEVADTHDTHSSSRPGMKTEDEYPSPKQITGTCRGCKAPTTVSPTTGRPYAFCKSCSESRFGKG